MGSGASAQSEFSQVEIDLYQALVDSGCSDSSNNAVQIFKRKYSAEIFETNSQLEFKDLEQEKSFQNQLRLKTSIKAITGLMCTAAMISAKRATHSYGFAVRGNCKFNDNLLEILPPNKFFLPGREFPILLRHSNANNGKDDNGLEPRSCSIRFETSFGEEGWDLLCNTGEMAGFTNLENFSRFLKMVTSASDEKYQNYLLNQPSSGIALIDSYKRSPFCFSYLHYHTQTCFEFIGSDGDKKKRYCKFRIVPSILLSQKTGDCPTDGVPSEAQVQEDDKRMENGYPTLKEQVRMFCRHQAHYQKPFTTSSSSSSSSPSISQDDSSKPTSKESSDSSTSASSSSSSSMLHRPSNITLKDNYEKRLEKEGVIEYRLQIQILEQLPSDTLDIFNPNHPWLLSRCPFLGIGVISIPYSKGDGASDPTFLTNEETRNIHLWVSRLPQQTLRVMDANSPEDFRSINVARSSIYPAAQRMRTIAKESAWFGSLSTMIGLSTPVYLNNGPKKYLLLLEAGQDGFKILEQGLMTSLTGRVKDVELSIRIRGSREYTPAFKVRVEPNEQKSYTFSIQTEDLGFPIALNISNISAPLFKNGFYLKGAQLWEIQHTHHHHQHHSATAGSAASSSSSSESKLNAHDSSSTTSSSSPHGAPSSPRSSSSSNSSQNNESHNNESGMTDQNQHHHHRAIHILRREKYQFETSQWIQGGESTTVFESSLSIPMPKQQINHNHHNHGSILSSLIGGHSSSSSSSSSSNTSSSSSTSTISSVCSEEEEWRLVEEGMRDARQDYLAMMRSVWRWSAPISLTLPRHADFTDMHKLPRNQSYSAQRMISFGLFVKESKIKKLLFNYQEQLETAGEDIIESVGDAIEGVGKLLSTAGSALTHLFSSDSKEDKPHQDKKHVDPTHHNNNNNNNHNNNNIIAESKHIHVPSSVTSEIDSVSLPSEIPFQQTMCTQHENYLMGLATLEERFESLDEISDLYGFLSHPEVMKDNKWKLDEEFGRQMLNGCNPYFIKKLNFSSLSSLPSSYSNVPEEVDRNHCLPPSTSSSSSSTFEEEMLKGNIYVADCNLLNHIPLFQFEKLDENVKKLVSACQRFVSSAIAFFHVHPITGKFLPIAIKLEQDAHAPVWTPKDPPHEWLLVKMMFKTADCNIHQMVSHLLCTHLLMEPFVVSALRNLTPSHPLSRLLHHHIKGVITINTLGRAVLIAPGGVADCALSIGGGGHLEIMAKRCQNMDFNDLYFPKMIASRGLGGIGTQGERIGGEGNLPGYYARDDGLLIWSTIRQYCLDFLSDYYLPDSSSSLSSSSSPPPPPSTTTSSSSSRYGDRIHVMEDEEIQQWVREIAEIGLSPMKNVPSSLHSLSDLVDFVTLFIYQSSAGHASVNFSQYDSYGFIPNCPGSSLIPIPKQKGILTEASILQFLPSKGMSAQQVATTSLLSAFMPEEEFLGEFCDAHIFRSGEFGIGNEDLAVAKFKDALVQMKNKIEIRNEMIQTQGGMNQFSMPYSHPYSYLHPSKVPNSIAI